MPTDGSAPDLRRMILDALHAAGGQDYLARQAEQNPVAFMGLLGKVLPIETVTRVKRAKDEARNGCRLPEADFPALPRD